MKNEIANNKEVIPAYFEDEYQSAVRELTSHMQNKEYYLHDRQIIYRDVKIQVDYSTKNLNQSRFLNCTFQNCNFDSASFVNSKFIKCKFISCNLQSTNFRGSTFENVFFDNNTLLCSTRFGKCKFWNCHFAGCKLESVVFDEAEHFQSNFINSKWFALSVVLCLFSNTEFDHVVFRNMNFEFSMFRNIHMNNMKLPFPTIPYIFGGLQYLKTTKDNIRVTSQHKKDTGISKEEYLSLLDKLEIYYAYSNNYFPLANIYIAQNKNKECKSAIILGIEKAIAVTDRQLIENYARLISYNSIFTFNERRDLFNLIISKISLSPLLYEQINEINKCIFNLRTLLLSPLENTSSFHLSIKTNIKNDSKQVALFLKVIENILGLSKAPSNHSIELRHNSPYEFFINYFSDYGNVCYTLGLLAFAVKGVDKILGIVTNHISSIQNIKKQAVENRLLEQQEEINELEISKRKQELQDDKKIAEEKYNQIQNNNIVIEELSYIIISGESNTIIQSSDIIY